MDKLQIVTLNVRGLKNKRKRRSSFHFLRKEKYDIVALQECHISTNDEAKNWEIQWGGKMFYSLGSNHRLGQIFLVAKKWADKVSLIYKDDRVLLIKLVTDNKTLIIANIYAPQSVADKIRFFSHIHEVADEHNQEDASLIILGDFNTVMNNEEDIITGEKHDRKETEALNQMISHLDIHDTWRTQHPGEKQYTWSRNHPFTARCLDYIFTSSGLLPCTENSQIVSFHHSDHRAVLTTLAFHDYKKGPSYWKFNNSLLKDIDYVHYINEAIEQFTQENTNLNPNDHWELCKVRIRELSIMYCQNKQRKVRTQLQEMHTKLNRMENEVAKSPDDQHLKSEIIKLKVELELNALAKAQGAQIRSRIKFIEEGEKNNAYFLNLEKSKAATNTITHLQTEDGNVITDQTSVLNEQVKYYTRLYKKDPDDNHRDNTYITDFLGPDGTTPVLDDHDKESCETQLNEIELAEALKHMRNGSAPGYDGLTTEFYKYFWSRIKTMLIKSYLHSFDNKRTSQTQRKGIVTLIHKGKNLPRENLSNWRPITLLNTDYKILAKAIAMKLNSVVPKLIAEDQCGFVRGRNIATILRTTDDIINFLNSENLPGILVGVDFTKAFDTISKTLIQDSLLFYGFGPNFRRWIETMLAETESSINHYGWVSAPFYVERGIRQGCPLSPLLFILAVELLAIKIRNSNCIHGIEINTKVGNNQRKNTIKIQQFADDTTLYLRDTKDLTPP
jgi:exonuclease III